MFLPDATDEKPTKNFTSVLRRLHQAESSPRRLPLRRFEVVNRSHNVDDVHRVGDGADDVLDGLVGARRLVDGALVHRGRIDALHGGPIFAQVERFPRLATRHDAARAVGRRVVPRLVAAPFRDDGAVAHVKRNEHGLSRVRGDGALAKNHLIHVDVVVDGMELRRGVKPRSRQNLHQHAHAVAGGEALTDINIVQVVVHVAAVEPAQVGGHVGFGAFVPRCELLERRLDLVAAPGRLVRVDELPLALEEALLAAVQIDGKALVVVRHLQPRLREPEWMTMCCMPSEATSISMK